MPDGIPAVTDGPESVPARKPRFEGNSETNSWIVDMISGANPAARETVRRAAGSEEQESTRVHGVIHDLSRNGAAELSRRFGSRISNETYPPGRHAPVCSSRSSRSSSGSRLAKNPAGPGTRRFPAIARRAAAHNASNVAKRSNRSSALRRLMRLPPAPDQPPGLVQGARRMLVAACIQVSEVLRQPAQAPQLFGPACRPPQPDAPRRPSAVARSRSPSRDFCRRGNFSTVGTSHSTKRYIDSTAGPVRRTS